ncbi:MAG: carbamoyltransferase HypF [Terriglobales bacterium]
MQKACSIRVRGVVQGVGFRPFVYRLATSNALAGWVLNGEQGVEIHIEGDEASIQSFVRGLREQAPPAAVIAELEVQTREPEGFSEFAIRHSEKADRPTVRVSPDLPICAACVAELFDENNRRHRYPYINCTDCGPRYTVILGLPYDRPNTTMKSWPLDEYCDREYHDPLNRRFHAQPVACPRCGPSYYLSIDGQRCNGDVIAKAVELLRAGNIVAVKGLGGYHLACDARNREAVAALRERKFRKEKPFAIMVPDLVRARTLIELSPDAEELMTSIARPIVLAKAKDDLPEVAPDNTELGVMLPYTPLHHLLFAGGAPEILVMTSANRSSEPIAYEDEDALESLSGIADAFLVGERPIARRVDDSVARVGAFGPAILRRARGYSPGAVTKLPIQHPLLAVGADLKNSVTLVVQGQAFVSQHIGDLDHFEAFKAFQETIRDLTAMYEVNWDDLTIVHDAHPQYVSTTHALTLPGLAKHAIQHHRAHIASVLAERGEFERRVLGVSFDGTGYGDDDAIWGGEFFAGSVKDGFMRVRHLRNAALPGGDAAARFPVQAAAGFLAQVEGLPDLAAAPFNFPQRYRAALDLVYRQLRTFPTSSMGRLFDTAAALLGFTRSVTFEGQAAMWLEQLARTSNSGEAYPFPCTDGLLDFRPLLMRVVQDRQRGRDRAEIARAFQRGIARGVADCATVLCGEHGLDTVVLSGGVFQNELLLEDLQELLGKELQMWTNHAVPPNDGGISLGQAAMAAFSSR